MTYFSEVLFCRFHDTVEGWPTAENPPGSCCMCHTKFDSADDEQKKTEHINYHLASVRIDEAESAHHYHCPMCAMVFEKAQFTAEQFAEHVEKHFEDDN